MKFIELTDLNSNKFIVPVENIVVVILLSEGSEVFLKDDSHFKVKESLAEIERKICRLGGDVQ